MTVCQQLLTLGLVVAVLAPAADVVSLDVVQRAPVTTAPTALAAYAQATTRKSELPAGVVDPIVTEVPLTPPSGVRGRALAGSPQARVVAGESGGARLTSLPQTVTGYGAVGVTWEPGRRLSEEAIQVHVRTETAQKWSEWMPVAYDADHGPDPRSAEAKRSRPGTDALLVGEVDEVQVKVTTPGGQAPPDLRLAVIAPGEPTATKVEAPAIDTGTVADSAATPASVPEAPATDETAGAEPGAIALRAATYTPKPVIYSRAQWGADERLRDKSSLRYFEVHAGFVHHTVNANNYTQAQVPGLLRSIYAYHTKSRGWSDLGYNYLVDRFGRIWEGRAGGVDRAVVGAHTLGYNDHSFAMSAIGNYDTAQPSAATVQAYGALFAWKLSLHGVSASSTAQRVGSKSFRAINGHRDAGSTACPGRYLYAKIPQIRTLAAATQRGWAGRELESNVASTPHPDVLVRRASDKMLFVLPTGGLTALLKARAVATGFEGNDTVVASPDLTGDGKGDLFVRSTTGEAGVMPGNGAGAFGTSVKRTGIFAGHSLITAVGDLDRNGRNDLVGRAPTGRLVVFLGTGGGSFARHPAGAGWGGYDRIVGAGDLNGDGEPDLIGRDTTGKVWLHAGTTGYGFKPRVLVAADWRAFDTISGLGDFNSDGRADLYVRRADTKMGYVVPGRGNGTFGSAVGPIGRTKAVSGITGAPLVAGGASDLVARRGGTVWLFPNRNSFETAAPIATGLNLSGANLMLNAGDWNRDGHGDMIFRRTSDGSLYLRLGNGKGQFPTQRLLATGFGRVRLLAAVGDMTGDGWPDLMGQPAGAAMRIYPGRGISGLAPGYVASAKVTGAKQIPVGRMDADGAPDVLVRSGTKLLLSRGNGPGGITSTRALSLSLAAYDWVVGISDIGLTGHSDLVVRHRTNRALYLIPMTATGFGTPRLLAEGMGGYDLAS